MKKLGLISVIALFGCDGGGGGDDAGMLRIDSGDEVDSGGVDAGRLPDAGDVDGGGTPGACGPTGPMAQCDLSDPTSCGAGMACQLLGSTAGGWMTMCFAAGTGTDGTACDPTMAGECVEGLACSQDENLCRAWCCSTADCEPGQICNEFGGADIGICVLPDTCSLVAPQTGCEAGEACNLLGDTGDVVCDACGDGGCDVAEGAECMFRNACMPGFGCVGECRAYCDMTATTPCTTEGFVCAPLGGAPENIGVCVPPDA